SVWCSGWSRRRTRSRAGSKRPSPGPGSRWRATASSSSSRVRASRSRSASWPSVCVACARTSRSWWTDSRRRGWSVASPIRAIGATCVPSSRPRAGRGSGRARNGCAGWRRRSRRRSPPRTARRWSVSSRSSARAAGTVQRNKGKTCERRDLFGHRVPVVLHRRASLPAGARRVPGRGPCRGRLPFVPARPERAGDPGPDPGLPASAVRRLDGRDARSCPGECEGRGDRAELGPGALGQHLHGAPSPPAGRARVRPGGPARAGREALRGLLHARRGRFGPRAPRVAGGGGRDRPRACDGVPRERRGSRGDPGRDRPRPRPRDHRSSNLRLRGPLGREWRAAGLGLPPGAGADRRGDRPGGRRGGNGRHGLARRPRCRLRRRPLRRMTRKFALSVLDLAPIAAGSTATQALRNTVELARLTERLGYTRFWLAEHHGMPSIASSSPEVLIAHVAARTERIRVGSGGIMLPNHAPLRIAEAFRTLEALHPGRIDLGIGRAPGTDPVTSSALRPFDAEQFPLQMAELLSLVRRDFPEDHPFHRVRVVPDDVPLPPIWILGSSGAGAAFAGRLGLGYGFASHFSPTSPLPALRAYRDAFQPSEWFEAPHVIVALSVACAETDERADYLTTSM